MARQYQTRMCAWCAQAFRSRSNRAVYCCPNHRYLAARKDYLQAYSQAHREKIRARQRQWAATHRKKLNLKHKAWRQANPEKARMSVRRSKQKHAEQVKAYNRRYRAEHREWERQYNRQYSKAHPETWQPSHSRRRARECGADGFHTPDEWRAKKALYGHRCFYCSRKMKRLTQDHVIPLSRGGTHNIDNIVPACVSCNSQKKAKTLETFHGQCRGQLKLVL